MIDEKLFKDQYNQIEEKMNQISKLDKPGQPQDSNHGRFPNIEIEEEGIYHTTEDRWGEDPFTFFIPWDEINEPIEYFENKYKIELKILEDEKKRKSDADKKKKADAREKRDRENYERLKKKFEG